MIKNIAIIILSLFLALTLVGAFYVLKDFALAEPKYSIPNWSAQEKEILNKVYSEIGLQGKVPLESYPYEIERTNDGYTIRFQTYEFLSLRDSVLFEEEVYDGCVYYSFDIDLKLKGITYCG